MRPAAIGIGFLSLALGLAARAQGPSVVSDPNGPRPAQAAVLVCEGMIDHGLFESIKRRAAEARTWGADYLILEIGTYGGELKAADDIAKLLILDLAPHIRTVAFIKTEAISAGALISVSCRDIVMREHTTIGDCAPIVMGGTLEGVEREKAESFTRAAFDRAARANGYPQALLRAMVTVQIEVVRVRNRQTGKFEFFEAGALPEDAETYDLETREVVDANDRLLTVDAATAHKYGIARALVADRQGVLDYLAGRDGVRFDEPARVWGTNWSEELVRKLNHPAVVGVLTLVALMGLYMELSAPGLGLPGLVAVIAFVTLVGSKYLVGMANWVEVAVLGLGIVLLLLELLVIPGFGVAGIAGAVCLVVGFFGLLVRNPPDRLPWPQSELDWSLWAHSLLGFLGGVLAFAGAAAWLGRVLPRTRLFSGLILAPSRRTEAVATGADPPDVGPRVGDCGRTVTPLHPAGRARFGERLLDCVTQREFLDANVPVRILRIRGNRIVVEVAEEASAESR